MNTIPDHVDILLQLSSFETRALGKAIRFYLEAHVNQPEREILHHLGEISQKVINLIEAKEERS